MWTIKEFLSKTHTGLKVRQVQYRLNKLKIQPVKRKQISPSAIVNYYDDKAIALVTTEWDRRLAQQEQIRQERNRRSFSIKLTPACQKFAANLKKTPPPALMTIRQISERTNATIIEVRDAVKALRICPITKNAGTNCKTPVEHYPSYWLIAIKAKIHAGRSQKTEPTFIRRRPIEED